MNFLSKENDYNSSRIGEKYQCVVNDWNGITPNKRELHNIWKPNEISSELLKNYLRFCKELFANETDHSFPSQFCEERGLYFLHQCNYQVDTAIDLLRPVPPDEDRDPDDEEADGDDFCLICGDGGNLILCDTNGCIKAYHPGCVHMDKVPEGIWECPRHVCKECKTKIRLDHPYVCKDCPNAYCDSHLPSNTQLSIDGQYHCPECLLKERTNLLGKDEKEKAISKKAFYDRLLELIESDDSNNDTLNVPHIGRREIDLYVLYKEVVKLGGIQNILQHVGWRKIKGALNLSASTSIDNQLKDIYINYLYSYEQKYFADSLPLHQDNINQGSSSSSRKRKASEMV